MNGDERRHLLEDDDKEHTDQSLFSTNLNDDWQPLRNNSIRPFEWHDAVDRFEASRSTTQLLFKRRRILVAITMFMLIALVLPLALYATGFFKPEASQRSGTSGSEYALGSEHTSKEMVTPGGATATGSSSTAGAVVSSYLPTGMPRHFAFGLMNAPGDVSLMNDMRSRNGATWDFRYQYLVGGVNTGHGWETWNTPAGMFASSYMQESASSGYVPTFVYYEMLQSNGSCGACSEQERDLSNLSNPSVMGAYFANWRLLMQKVGSFGKSTLVIVEPDLWGFMEQSVVGLGNMASGVPASVGSSGDVDAKGYPDTAQGYAWALLHIRDRYAPQAILALHVSSWATRQDISSETSASLDARSVAAATAQFLQSAGLRGNPAGISSWNLLSNDVADHDNGQGAPWWDTTNHSYPNFARYLTFIHTLSQYVGRNVVMWQAPEGNQYFDTENNTPHHTQDNRAQYILAHVEDFATSGIIGVLFGPGNGGTMVDDAAHDGVTNPAPISTQGCDYCNTHTSKYPDDDGGYLRIFVGQYYRNGPLPLE